LQTRGRSKAVVTLKDDVPAALEDALRKLPDVEVVAGSPEDVLIVDGRITSVRPGVVGLADAEAARAGRSRLWLVDGVLDRETATRLEDLEIGFVDRAGRWWLPGLPRTVTVLHRAAARRIRGPQIRMAQLLADHPGVGWTQRRLAERANSTQQTAHRLLTKLEEDGLVTRDGAGRSSRRTVEDQRALWDWLARACAPGRGGLLRCFAPDPLRLPQIEVPLALSGSHAADVLGVPVISGERAPVYRARTTRAALEEVPAMLGGIRTAQGANLLLVPDLDDLAHLDARRLSDGRLVAPPSRVMLDLHLEPRGGATSEVFRELWTRRGDLV
jgi:DNA-binding Lrp family transcriptional regulator